MIITYYFAADGQPFEFETDLSDYTETNDEDLDPVLIREFYEERAHEEWKQVEWQNRYERPGNPRR